MSVRWLLGFVAGSVTAAMSAAAVSPVAVSPGHSEGLAVVEARCPTFSWSEADGAESYELVVYRISAEGEAAEPVLQERFEGSIESWTPSLERCLERGGRYGWSVRAVGPEQLSEWSAPRLFEIASAPRETEPEWAVTVVQEYLARAAGRTLDNPAGASRDLEGIAPVRLDAEPEPAAPVAVSEILDPYVQKVVAPFGALGLASETVPYDQITPRCGDEDGCRLRLIAKLTAPGTFRADDIQTRVFSTSTSGTQWFVSSDDGSSRKAGSTTDTMEEFILVICRSCSGCAFKDGGPSFVYQLIVQNSVAFPDAFECLLRIDD